MKVGRATLWFIIFLTIAAIVIQSPLIKQLHFRKGLDLEGGTSITLRAEMKEIPSNQRDKALDSAKAIIEQRVNVFGVSEPIIQTAKVGDDYRIIVDRPGVSLEEALKLVRPAKLEFREVATTSGTLNFENTKPTGLSGADLENAQPDFDRTSGAPVVLFKVKSGSQEKFFNITQSLVGKHMAIFIDGVARSAPTVQTGIRDSGQITGVGADEAKELSKFLNIGALPVPLTILSTHSVGPTLGIESLKKSLFAGVLGFIIIVLFMSILYRRLGILASIALSLYVLVVLSIFKLSSITPYGITLTLSGIAGFILSIGMAVDANILIFERMKEEERLGRSRDIAINLGFSRAFPSIRDSNVSTIITSLVLYYFGTGAVRGFALVLAIGVLVSMFSAIVVTRNLIKLFYR